MKKVIVRGPALSRSGYGEHTRFLLRSLKNKKDLDLYLLNTPWGATSWLNEDTEEREWIDSLLLKTLESGKDARFDLSLQVTIPNEWRRMADKNIGVTAGIETNKISDSWLQSSMMVDKIIVPSEHSKQGFLNNKREVSSPDGEKTIELSCQTPIDVVSFPFRDVEPENLNLNLVTSFNFLTVAQISPRKNIEASLLAFLEEFQNEEDVGYVIKVNIKNNCLIDRRHTESSIKNLLDSYPDRKCKVYVLHGNMSDEEIAGLYTDNSIHGYVSTSHGEGFGLPIFESCAYGLPVIAPNWSGYADFTNNQILEVGYELREVQDQAIWEGVIEKGSEWCYVNLADVRSQMRELYNNQETHKETANKLKESIRKKYSAKQQNKKMLKSIKEILK